MATLNTDIRYIKGVGEARAKSLAKLGITDLRSLLSYFPRAYDDRRAYKKIADLIPGENACVCAVIAGEPKLSRIRKGLDLVKLRAVDETGALELTYFNQSYLKNTFHTGDAYVFFGRAEGTPSRPQMTNPLFEREGTHQTTGRIMPIYPLTAGVSQSMLYKAVEQGLAACVDELPDILPEDIRLVYQLCHTRFAYENIHFPTDDEALSAARRRLAFEELFLLCCGLQQLKERRRADSGILFRGDRLEEFFAALPFAPTGAQRRAIMEIAADCASGRPMNRLVQGDVGSGKTVVAAALCALAAQNGWQAAFMAPTEILAAQHAETLSPMLGKLGLTCTLLTGSMTAAQKRAALAAIESGAANVVVGTHALIQQSVVFHRLGAVIADEQHRFGVAQRAALSAKGEMPHVLVMSATPIPRTLALIMYGDLDVSILDETPPGRSPVETYAVGENMRRRITAFIEKQLAAGGQVYVVCPLVEDGEGDSRLKSAEQHAKDLQAQLPHRRVAVLHGRMKNAEKDAVMRDFAAQKYDILVATTVIEVGVDVPNANLMVVEDADRFGLSQLHQLRGRVGRGTRQSYCVFFGADKGATARERLKILCKTNDGFEIARADLSQRGPGDFFGRRQHGLPALHVADLAADLALMQNAREEAEALLAADPSLSGWPLLKERVHRMFAERDDEAFN